ncbi:MAG: hypothetical protein DHS20C12_12290 [Pseudohongiella sp.]|nr:MAG: hypothetical protein DHS20C12_12290 [Pseudohongiella sp.]
MLFFENTKCLSCGFGIGFDPASMKMRRVADEASGQKISRANALHRCKNSTDYDVCNWLVNDPNEEYCLSCKLNHTIPNLLDENRRSWWKSLEYAKRRLIYSLLSLNLPVVGKHNDPMGLAFKFMEDQRTNPEVFEEHVNTGHLDGMITINIAEADRVKSEIARQYTRELYRTLLGHFRHESGHYYFLKLITTDERKQQFIELFGDYNQDYASALKDYYKNNFVTAHDPNMISHYAQSHPWEDWAEVWAHYLHMIDTLETANQYRVRQSSAQFDDIDNTLRKWGELTLLLNSLNRSMGLEDAYPFVLSELSLRKLRFVHGLIYPS